MAEIFKRCFRGAAEGHAVYPKVSGDQMKPGACGYFNRHHDWITVVQTLDKDELAKHDLTTLDDAILIDCGDDDQWDIRRSGNITIKRIQLDANASAPGAPGGGAALKFTSNRGEGAIMVPGSTVTERRAEPASAFRKWMAKNAQKVIAIPICDEEAIRDKGLWIITKTFTAKRRAIAVLETAGSEISIGVDVTIPTVVKARSAVGFWKSAEHSTGWIVQRNEKNGVVLFSSGIYYKPRLFSRELKAVEDKERQRWLEAGVKRSPIDVELVQSAKPCEEYIRLWPCAFGRPDGLGELPMYEESGDEKATDDESGDKKAAEDENPSP